SPAAVSVRLDLTDYGQVVEALSGVDDRHDGVDAVVHLAAIPAPGLTTNSATFANNAPSTYNVFAAARAAGVRNVVWASSETVLANADTVTSGSSAELAAEVYPGVPVTRELGEHETMLSIDKARRVLGYEPEHSWRDEACSIRAL